MDADEARHLRQILRKRVGDQVEIFDGHGATALAAVREIRRDEVALDVLETRTDPSGDGFLTLAVAPPKGERLKWMVEKLVELGVTRLELLLTERSVVDPGREKLRGLEQTVIAACKQSGRNHLMQIVPPIPWREWLLQTRSRQQQWYFADPLGTPFPAQGFSSEIAIAIGPEGGFSPQEVTEAEQHGGQPISLGPQILRIETAAIAIAGYQRLTTIRSQ